MYRAGGDNTVDDRVGEQKVFCPSRFRRGRRGTFNFLLFHPAPDLANRGAPLHRDPHPGIGISDPSR